jgi:CheY-like chemotaxis protein
MRVLLAEDEETIAVTLCHALEDAGHEVVRAGDTRAALEQLAAGKSRRGRDRHPHARCRRHGGSCAARWSSIRAGRCS